MAITINASTSSGLQLASDTSGVVTFQSNGTNTASITTGGNLQFNSGYGSVATAYGCRAWVNFNGTGTIAIRASGNVTSLTDNGTGDYTVNFTNAQPDVNFSVVASTGLTTLAGATGNGRGINVGSAATTSIRTSTFVTSTTTQTDFDYITLAIFR